MAKVASEELKIAAQWQKIKTAGWLATVFLIPIMQHVMPLVALRQQLSPLKNVSLHSAKLYDEGLHQCHRGQ